MKNKDLLPKKDWGIQDDLIDELQRLYPDIAPSIDMQLKDIYYRAGQISVVRKLKEMQNDKKKLYINAKNQS